MESDNSWGFFGGGDRWKEKMTRGCFVCAKSKKQQHIFFQQESVVFPYAGMGSLYFGRKHSLVLYQTVAFATS